MKQGKKHYVTWICAPYSQYSLYRGFKNSGCEHENFVKSHGFFKEQTKKYIFCMFNFALYWFLTIKTGASRFFSKEEREKTKNFMYYFFPLLRCNFLCSVRKQRNTPLSGLFTRIRENKDAPYATLLNHIISAIIMITHFICAYQLKWMIVWKTKRPFKCFKKFPYSICVRDFWQWHCNEDAFSTRHLHI